MNAFSLINMREVTRLTRAGKLTEALMLLQSHLTSGIAHAGPAEGRPGPAGETQRPSSAIDMVSPSETGGAWTAPSQSGDRATNKAANSRHLVPPTFRDHLFTLGPALAGRQEVAVPDGARFEERTFSNHVGSRTYKVYVPSSYAGRALPVVVMLHGCTQDPDDFAAGTRMNELAEEQSFLVAYPRQPQSANMQKCWNWFNASDQQREGGEPSLIAGIALQVIEEFAADPARVYVAGLSAGGAAAAIMAATYPDLFAAAGVHSGLACGAAKDMPSAFAAMAGHGVIRRQSEGPLVPTIVFHGNADRTVNPVNGDQVVAQAGPEAALTKVVTRGQSPGGISYTRIVQRDDAGTEVLEQWVLHGAGHAWAGGSGSGSYTDPRGPNASREMIRFFLAHVNAKAAARP
jgi:poly(hydroxyalkanoate) depolymerase family esterase